MDYGLSIKLKQTNKQTFFEDLYKKLWKVLTKNTRHYATTKASEDIVNYYLNECFSASCYEEEESFFYYFFPESAGCTATSASVSMHWVTLSLGQLYDEINKQMDRLGYVFDPDVSTLASYTSDALFIEIDNKICQLYSDDELLTDDETLEISKLSKEDKKRVKNMSETGLCQCPMCLEIRGGKAPVKFRITKPKKSTKSVYENLTAALRYPDHVKKLNINWKDSHPLTNEIEKFTAIESLRFYQPDIIHIPNKISTLKTLTSLSIDAKKLKNLPEDMGNLVNLKELHIHAENVILPESFSKLVNLEKLYLETGEKDSFPSFIYNYSKLKTLYIWKKSGLHGAIESIDFSKFPNLESIELYCPTIESFPLSIMQLKKLKILEIGGPGASFVIPEELYNLESLEELSLATSGKFEFNSNIKKLSNLEKLKVCDCTKLKSLPKEISECKKLTRIDLSDSGVNTLPESIGECKNLEFLDVSCSYVKILPESMGNLKKLYELRVTNSLVKRLPESMKNSKSLNAVHVSNSGKQYKNIPRQREEWGLYFKISFAN